MAVRSKRRNLLGLSATVSNADAIAEWLNATPVKTNWRPVPSRKVYL